MHLAAAGVAVLGVLAACGGDSGSGDSGGETVKLGSLLPTTGDLAPLGENTLNATKLAVKEATAGDAAVELISQDGGSQESIAQSAVQQLLAEDPVGIVGAVSSAVCLSVIDTVVQSEIPMISPACTSPQLTTYEDDGLFYRTAAPSDVQGALLADVAYEDGVRSVALMAVNNSYGQSISERFVERFTELGGEVAAEINYDAAAKTFTAEVQQVAAAEPDAVVLIGYADTGAAIVHDASQRGLLDLPWYTGDGIQDASFPTEALPNSPEQLYSWKGIGIGAADSDAASTFAKAYQEEYGEEAPSFSAQAYDSAWVLLLAGLKAQASDTDPVDEIANVLDPEAEPCIAADCLAAVQEGTNVAYQGATGLTAFDENGDPTSSTFVIWQFAADGITTLQTLESGQ
ncbi:ABC transporter substrate-binding protein [Ornithinimicrobium cavernae]|uniref:ABC transporter substrate-binding protein n=1 Tax=Ornithinimicrobium cavernae TaxID=2666047 RepID=UPI0013793C7E|nr:ABC transporter substrate-binding protein [Ornithinimicrobium cavernae]